MATGDPLAFLAAFEGEPHGFWGRGDRWVAWGGALERIEIPGSSPAPSGGDTAPSPAPAPSPGPTPSLGSASRFDRVRDAAARAGARLSGSPDRDAYPFEAVRFFGGFAFDEGGGDEWRGFGSATFILPRAVLVGRGGELRFHAWEGASSGTEARATPSPRSDREGTDPGPATSEAGSEVGWRRGVDRVLRAIRSGPLEKVVLARVRELRAGRPVRPLEALGALRRENEGAHVFLFEPVPGRSFLGAAPEILARLQGGRFEATAVAGSAPRGGDPSSDDARARGLLASAKDQAEYRLTLEEMIESLEGRLLGMEFDRAPSVLKLAMIQHLETVIRGSVAPGEDILSLVEALHPTPAVCGRPRKEALALIRAEEPFRRGWYAGPIGWFDLAGDGDFVPALRSAVGGGRSWRLFAGAGIVEGSDPASEWAETELKLEPALRALRAGEARE